MRASLSPPQAVGSVIIMSPTGLRFVSDTLYKGQTIIVLDAWQRLQYSFAVSTDNEYKTFRTMRAAKQYIRSIGA